MAACNRGVPGVCQLPDGIADIDVITVVVCCEFVHAGVVFVRLNLATRISSCGELLDSLGDVSKKPYGTNRETMHTLPRLMRPHISIVGFIS
jgi:hypothetical protein